MATHRYNRPAVRTDAQLEEEYRNRSAGDDYVDFYKGPPLGRTNRRTSTRRATGIETPATAVLHRTTRDGRKFFTVHRSLHEH